MDGRTYDGRNRKTAKIVSVMLMLLCLMFSLSACRAVEGTESAVEEGWDDLTGETGTMNDGVYEDDRNQNGTLDHNETLDRNETLNHETNTAETGKNESLNNGTETERNGALNNGTDGMENGTVHDGANNSTERNRTGTTDGNVR